MFLQYTVLGFELTSFGNESPPLTTRPATFTSIFYRKEAGERDR